MAKRKSLSKRVRFEVFKRDSFKCQYCGAAAPDVILNVDHITPVAEGGDDDIANLLTACHPCNSGKSCRSISDTSAVSKRKRQLDDLQERREQLEMMGEWQRGLIDLDGVALRECQAVWVSISSCRLNEKGLSQLGSHIRRFGFAEVMDAIRKSARYLKFEDDGNPTIQSAQQAFDKVPGICIVEKRMKDDPCLPMVYRLRGRLRANLDIERGSWRDIQIIRDINSMRQAGFEMDFLWEQFSTCTHWPAYQDNVREFLR